MSIPYLLGTNNIVNLGPLKYWAERGLVHCEDSRDGSCETIDTKIILERIKALNDMIGNTKRKVPGLMHADEIRTHQNFIDDMVQLCRAAADQGSPDNPDAIKDLRRRRPATVVVPSAASQF